jgi:hypothetical protein
MIFKYANLKSFFLNAGSRFPVTSLKDWNQKNGIILRHDVDLDIRPAYELAKLEKACSVNSTFFIMTTQSTYNPAFIKNAKMLREMVSMGFEIGLHFDPSIYPEKIDLKTKVDEEAQLLENILDTPIESISLHNPARFGQFPLFDGYNNAYDKRIFSDSNYISDSRMIFKKDLLSFVEKAKTETVQVLLHPLHYSPTGHGYDEIFLSFMRDFSGDIDEHFKQNITYANQVKPSLLSHISSSKGENF